MSRSCPICGKGPTLVWRRKKLRGKYNPTARRKQFPNLQWTKTADGKRVKACAQCIKSFSKAS